jgi:hypothetical protein
MLIFLDDYLIKLIKRIKTLVFVSVLKEEKYYLFKGKLGEI